ncbi:helix-turn-helix transcriptional regulator [Pseudonocardia parietis]|uniref:DNA-binding transcriptional regulator YafY n=1 Tax=Pseudonocardia parietis TaxID=570936 RepID=A0ABS4VWA5_9PSEU|nr:WYL domain-containing protein [Pseudonocardia parietis]MBP2368227.1 putative DNA-binding transcriptional regulator YafY [Pseudonocardia parietis]
MSRPTSRVLTVLELLQTGGTRTRAELAERLGVDERTVRRYVGHLIDLEIPVVSVRGRYGGYRLGRGYRLPPLMFTDEEAVAVCLGLIAGSRTGLTTAAAAAGETARAKIRRVLPTASGARLDALLGTVSFTGDPVRRPAPGPDVLLAVADSVQHRRPLAFGYTNATGERSARRVHPHGLVAHSGRWYVTALDPTIAEDRTFRLDRMSDVRAVEGAFAPPEDRVDAATRVLDGIAAAPRGHEVVVRVRGVAEEVRARLPAGLAVVERLGRESRVTLHAERLDWVPGVLIALDRGFVVERPPELRERLAELAARLVRAAVASEH